MISQELDLSEDQMDEIVGHIKKMRRETQAHCILLSDVSGQLIEEQGSTIGLNTAGLSALAAGELAATKEMARLVGEKARFKLLLHEGKRRSVYLSDVAGEMLLVTVFGNTTPIGMIRLWTRNTVDRLKEVVNQARERPPGTRSELTLEFEELLSQELDSALGG